MRTLYLDCGMGAAGDMLTAALLELGFSEDELTGLLGGNLLSFIEKTQARTFSALPFEV